MRWKLWLGVGGSLVFLWLAVRGVRLEELGETLGHVRGAWLLPVVASVFVRFWLTAIRWQLLLRPVRRIGVHRLFGVTMIGFMANNVLPARMGEFVRAYALGKSESLAAPLAFATIVLERVFDGFTLLLFLVGGLLFLRPEPWLVFSAAATFCLYLGVLAALVSLRGPRGLGLARRLLGWLPQAPRTRALGLLDAFASGLGVLAHGRALVGAGLLSLLIWGVNAAGVHAMFLALTLDLPAHASFLLLAVIAVAVVVPSTPGYVGPFQAGTVFALALFAVPKASALSLSILYHAANYIPITAVGLAYLGALNLTLGELKAAGERAS